MAIDKELFYASHELKYPVVARPYTDDMTVQEKVYTKDEVVAMLKEIQKEIEEKIQGYEARSLEHINAMYEASMSGRMFGYCGANEIIQERIDKLKGEQE